MAKRNPAWERIHEDFAPVFPGKDIVCKHCAFKLNPIGEFERYTNGYCEIYTPEISNGKPHGILFDNESCKYYQKDTD